MILHLLAVGDVVGQSGLDYLTRHLRSLKKLKAVDFTVVNGRTPPGWASTPSRPRSSLTPGVT